MLVCWCVDVLVYRRLVVLVRVCVFAFRCVGVLACWSACEMLFWRVCGLECLCGCVWLCVFVCLCVFV